MPEPQLGVLVRRWHHERGAGYPARPVVGVVVRQHRRQHTGPLVRPVALRIRCWSAGRYAGFPNAFVGYPAIRRGNILESVDAAAGPLWQRPGKQLHLVDVPACTGAAVEGLRGEIEPQPHRLASVAA